jgi:hypothetical protein
MTNALPLVIEMIEPVMTDEPGSSAHFPDEHTEIPVKPARFGTKSK